METTPIPEEYQAPKQEAQDRRDQREKEHLQVVEHRFGGGLVREYVNKSVGVRVKNFMSGFPYQEEIAEIEYISPDGKAFKLSSLLPKDYRFARGYVAGAICDQGSKALAYGEREIVVKETPEGEVTKEEVPFFENDGAFLVLLHEIGHSRRKTSVDESRSFREATRDLTEAVNGDRPIDPALIQFYEEKVVQSERDAWAYALSTLRKLRREGIDLAPGLPSVEQIRPEVHLPLTSYEILSRVAKELKKSGQLSARTRELANQLAENPGGVVSGHPA